jgi:hypothetical protein
MESAALEFDYHASLAAAYTANAAAKAEQDKILALGVKLLLLAHHRQDLIQS